MPITDIPRCDRDWRYSITSSARAIIDYGIVRPSEGMISRCGLCPLSGHAALEFGIYLEPFEGYPTEMFGAGPVSIKFAYYGAEDARQIRPFITTQWIADSDDMAEVMERGRTHCVCASQR